MAVLTTDKLCKNYGSVAALRDVSLEVPDKSIFGLLGPNGSGKTTFLGIILSCLQSSAGSFRWREGEVRGCLLETPNFYPYLSGRDNLEIVAQIRGSGGTPDEISQVLETVGLSSYPDLLFSKYSLGMKQRLAIGSALLGSPPVVVLDEPTNGLDPAGIADVREVIRKVASAGRTVILASHMLDEVEKVCTHVAILKKGQLLSSGALGDVLRDEDTIEIRAEDVGRLREVLAGHPKQPKLSELPGDVTGLVVRCEAGHITPLELNRFCAEQGVYLSHLVLRKKTLESRFLELTDK